ncbi:MAG: AgmX/PglI C-terminal domain-containing protein [Bdellovibrionales bacterium]|nr:AgmX/PglI C-terminal domain-containing protein [Bdellovibrionales bacterium]
MSDTPTKPTSTPNPSAIPVPTGTPRHLVVFSQIAPSAGRIYRLHKDRIVLGSVVSADVHLHGDGVSPIHAVIEISTEASGSPRAMIFDLASDTGVFINGTKHVTASIKTGDEITIGRFRLRFAVEDPNAIKTTDRVRETSYGKLIADEKEDLAPLNLQDERDVYEIFDYRPTSKQALEVVMSWSSTILDVEHFVNDADVTVGADRAADFAIPSTLSSSLYPIAVRGGDGYQISLDPSMKGVIQRSGQLMSLEQFGQVTGSRTLNLGKNEFAKIKLGEVDFYFSYTAAPPRLKARRLLERDPFFRNVMFGSLALTLALIFAAMNVHLNDNIEVEQLPERLATIIYQPTVNIPKPKEIAPPEPKVEEKAPTKPEPEPKKEPPKNVKVEVQPTKKKEPAKTIEVNKNVSDKNVKGGPGAKRQNEAKEGAGAKAKGAEGQRGDKHAAPSKTHQQHAKRPSPQGGKGAGGGSSQVQDQGNVDLLKGAVTSVGNILGNTNAKLGTGGSELQGFGNFSTLGKGGQALSGEGKGGGGDAEGLGGLADKGRGGGRVGTGLGAAGKGTGIIGGGSRVALRLGGDGEGVVTGSMDTSAIAAAIEAHKDAFRYCYEKEVNAGLPNLAGTITTTSVIGSSGRITDAGIKSSSMGNANVERCVLGVLRRIDFPVPQGGTVTFTFPFKFARSGNQ